jgi:hypothetical protein
MCKARMLNLTKEPKKSMEKHKAPTVVIQVITQKLAEYLAMPSEHHQIFDHSKQIHTSVQHQNLVGWDNFCCGYISNKWRDIKRNKEDKSKWYNSITGQILELSHNIWTLRNEFIHRKTLEEQRVHARQAIIAQVKEIYRMNHRLHTWYASIYEVPLSKMYISNKSEPKGLDKLDPSPSQSIGDAIFTTSNGATHISTGLQTYRKIKQQN